MSNFLRQSTASQSRTIGPFVDSTDFLTTKTGLTIANTDIKLLVNGGASANKNSGGGTHRANGHYGVTFDATDTATVGEMEVSVVVSGALPVFKTFFVVEEAVYDEMFGASALGYVANAPVNVAQFGGTNLTSASGIPEVKVASIAANAVTAAAIADAAIDRATFAADTGLVSIRSNTAQAGASGSITLDASASAVDDFYKSTWILITGGTGVGQAREITGYTGSTKVATIVSWATTPDNTSTFAILPAATIDANVTQYGGINGTFSNGVPSVNVTKVAGTSQTGRDLGASVLISSGTGTGQLDVTSGVVKANATQFNGSNVTSSSGRPEVNVTHFGGSAGTFSSGRPQVSVFSLVAGAIIETSFGVGTGLQPIRSNAAQAGASGSITLDASASSVTDFYKGARIVLDSGTGVGQARLCTAYDGSTKVATIAPNWATNPTSGTTFAIVSANSPGSVEGNVTGSVGSVAGAVGSVTGNVGGNVTGSIGSLATQAKADVNAEADTALADVGVTTTITGRIDAAITTRAAAALFTGITSVAQWLGLIAGKQTGNSTARTEIRATGAGSGTFDETTDSQEALRDNMGTAQTGDAYARLGAPAGASVSADVAAVKSDTGAIKAKTDNLPASPAATGDIPTANQNADALLDRANGVESSFSLRQSMRLMLSALAGKLSGAAGTTVTIRDVNDTKDRIVATVDTNGNRTAVTTDPS